MNVLKEADVKILVVGDLMIDHYLWGSCERISPEAPVQIVDVSKETMVLGGAGNVINNLISLGADVNVSSVIGDDKAGDELSRELKSIGIDTKFLVVEKSRKTSKKSRIISGHQQVLRYDKESKEDIKEDSSKKLLENIEASLEDVDILILSDYAKGVLTKTLTKDVIELANKLNKPILVDPKGDDYGKYKNANIITPNKKEASIASFIDIKDDKSLKEAAKKLKNDLNLDQVIITLSEDGIAIYEDELTKIPTVAKEVYDVTGAGDTVIASLAFALGAKRSLHQAVYFANEAAAVVVGKIGSATVTLSEIDTYVSELGKSSSDMHIKSQAELAEIVKWLKSQNKKIVFTNGCFDILHYGHVRYLEEAKSYGDILIIGLNSDSSVRRLKGEERPINSEDDRAYILASLEAVNYVVHFSEDTPYELIKALEPDILVKGGDYKGKNVVGSDIVKIVRLVDFVDGKSTTSTIEKIKQSTVC